MDEAESKAAEVIARNIEQLESAVNFASTKMDAALFEAACDVLRKKNDELRWESEFGSEFGDEPWLAPLEWRADGEPVGGEYHLYCYLEFDELELQTWLAHFSGVGGRKVHLSIATNTVSGKKNLKKLASAIEDDLQKLLDAGFYFDVEKFSLKLLIDLDRDLIARGFADDDLSRAVAPLGDALDRIVSSREILDRIKDAVEHAAA